MVFKKIDKNTKKELVIFDSREKIVINTVIERLMFLPAYKPTEDEISILQMYDNLTPDPLKSKPVNNQEINKSDEIIIIKNKDKSIIFKRPSFCKKCKLALKLFPKIRIYFFFLSISYVLAFLLFRVDNIYSKIIGLLALLAFISFYFYVFSKIYFLYEKVHGTFRLTGNLVKDISEYIQDSNHIINKSISDASNLICQGLIKESITDLINHKNRRIIFYSTIYSFLATILVIYLTGDLGLETIKWIAVKLGISNYIPAHNLLTFATFILFPFILFLFQFILNEALSKRLKKLQRSLDLVVCEENILGSGYQ